MAHVIETGNMVDTKMILKAYMFLCAEESSENILKYNDCALESPQIPIEKI